MVSQRGKPDGLKGDIGGRGGRGATGVRGDYSPISLPCYHAVAQLEKKKNLGGASPNEQHLHNSNDTVFMRVFISNVR